MNKVFPCSSVWTVVNTINYMIKWWNRTELTGLFLPAQETLWEEVGSIWNIFIHLSVRFCISLMWDTTVTGDAVTELQVFLVYLANVQKRNPGLRHMNKSNSFSNCNTLYWTVKIVNCICSYICSLMLSVINLFRLRKCGTGPKCRQYR